MSEVENEIADALSCRVCLIIQLNIEAVSFERIKEEYESCLDFGEILVVLKEGVTPEIDDFLLQDDYLFQFGKLCISRTFLRDYFI